MDKKKLNIELYKTIHLIRAAEEGIINYYNEDEMKTPMHMSMGEEAITAGICRALKRSDQVFGYYRSHALYISKTNEVEQFFGEMYGKATGCVMGKGGSMHLAAPEHGLMLVSAIVASTIAPAVGAAFANKIKKNGKITVSFFGDGAVEEGVFFESLNAACLMELPIIFVCQDNGLAVDVVTHQRQGFKSITAVASSFNCHLIESKSTDAEEIYHLAMKAINLIRKTKKPVFMRLKYYRMLQHIGILSDFDKEAATARGGFEKVGYRSKEEYKEWMTKDPVKTLRQKLVKLGISKVQIDKIEKSNRKEVERSVKLAKEAPFPKQNELFNHIFFK